MAKDDKKNKKNKKADKKSKKENKNPKNQGSNNGQEPQIVRRLDSSLALTKMQCVILNKKNAKGKKIRGVFLPIDKNFLHEKDGAVYLNIRISLKDGEDSFGQHGFVGQSVASELYKAASDKDKEKMKKTPILGGVKDWEFDSSSTSNDSAGNAGEIGDDDDLPF